MIDHDYAVARARRCKVLLGQDDINQAFGDIERDLFEQWASLAWDEKSRAEMLRADQRALVRLRGKLQEWADFLALNRIE